MQSIASGVAKRSGSSEPLPRAMKQQLTLIIPLAHVNHTSPVVKDKLTCGSCGTTKKKKKGKKK